MTQSSRPQADNIANGYLDSGPYSRDQWSERIYAVHTGDENTAGQRARLRSVVPTFDNMLVVTEPVAGTIRVGTGAGLVYGSFLFNSAAVDFDAAGDAPAANPRIDLVCLVENNTNGAVNDGTAANGWIFPTDLTDYDAAASIPAYCARLVIVKGAEAAVPAEPALDVSNTLFMVAITKYEIAVGGVISAFEDRREFIDLEKVVSVNATENDEIADALILGVEVNDGVGAAGLGVGVKFRLESSAGTAEDAGQLAVRYTDAAAADETRLELRLKANGSNNLAAVINAPTAASADGNARGAGAVDLQQERTLVTMVASGTSSFACNENNTASGAASSAEGEGTIASGTCSHSEGYQTTASGGYSHSEGNTTEATADYSHAEGGATKAWGEYSHAEGNGSVASGARSHAEGSTTTASNAASHAEGGETISSGIRSHAEGSTTTASGENSHSGGYYAVSSKFSQFSRAGGRFAAAGDGQYSDYHLRRSVTHSDANWYQLYLDGAALRLTVAADQVMTFDALIVGTTQGCTKSFAFRIVGIVENDGGTTSLLASTVTTIYDGDDADFDARASADDANDALLIEVTDSTSGGDVVRWSAVVRTAEVTFPA